MSQIKQKTIDGVGTVRLLRLENQFPDLSPNKWMYVVEFPDGDRGDARFTKENGMREFRRTVSAFERAESSDRGGRDRAESDPLGFGLDVGGRFF